LPSKHEALVQTPVLPKKIVLMLLLSLSVVEP
jgi:hypothetical protein